MLNYDGDSYRPMSIIGEKPSAVTGEGTYTPYYPIAPNRQQIRIEFRRSETSTGSEHSEATLTVYGNDEYEDATATIEFTNFTGQIVPFNWQYAPVDPH